MKTTGYRSTFTARGPGPLNSKICSMSIPLTVANFFFKVFFVAKKLARWKKIVIDKCRPTIDGYAY